MDMNSLFVVRTKSEEIVAEFSLPTFRRSIRGSNFTPGETTWLDGLLTRSRENLVFATSMPDYSVLLLMLNKGTWLDNGPIVGLPSGLGSAIKIQSDMRRAFDVTMRSGLIWNGFSVMMDKFQQNLELTIIRMRGLLFLSFFFSVNKSTDETNTISCQQNVAEFSSHEHLQRTLLLSGILVSFKIFKNGHFIVKNLYKTGTLKNSYHWIRNLNFVWSIGHLPILIGVKHARIETFLRLR